MMKYERKLFKKMYFDILVTILCGLLTLVISLDSPRFDSEYHNVVSSFIMNQFPDECVCFFKDSNHNSSLFSNVLEIVANVKLVTLVSPIDDGIPVDMYRMEPRKPHPCGYVVILPYVGSSIPWSLLRGHYYSTSVHLDESHYLLVAEESHSREEIEQVLMEMFSYGFLSAYFLNSNNDEGVNAYTLFPFGRDFKSCPEESALVERIATWYDGEPKQFLSMFPKKLPDGQFNGCLWNISCAHFNPYLLVDNGGQYRGPLEGYDAGPLSLMMERMNLTPHWKIDEENLWTKALENGTIAGSLPDLALGRGAQMSCGALTLYWAAGSLDATMFYTWSSVQWYVAAPNKAPKWLMLIWALNKSIWPFIVASALIVPTAYWIFCTLCKQPQPFSRVLLSFTALAFGNFTCRPPAIFVLRSVFLAWLLYVLHIDQFYLASLTGLITSAGYEPMIKTIDQLIASNLPTVGYIYLKSHLARSPQKNIKRLLQNFIVIDDDEKLNNTLLELSNRKNFSVVDNEIFIKHILSTLRNVSIYPTAVMNDEFTMSALMWRHNYLYKRINRLFLKMYDAGFPVYFLRKFILPNQFWADPMDKTARALTIEDLSGPFYMLIVGLSVSIVVFLCEVLLFETLQAGKKPKDKMINKFLH